MPGHPFDARSSGCNMLIRDGSTLIRSAQDVIEALASPAPKPEKSEPAPRQPVLPVDTAALHQQILDRLGPSPVPEDQLIRDLNVPTAAASPEITNLELEGRLRREPGGMLIRID